MNPKATPYIVTTGFLFGSSLVASRFGVGQFAPLVYVGLRLLIAGTGFLLFYLLSSRSWPPYRRLWRHALILGFVGTAVPMAALTTALLSLSSGLVSILAAAGPALTIVLAHFFLSDERLNTRKGLGVLLALGGALLLIIRGENGLPNVDVSRESLVGYGLIVIALLSIGFTTIYIRKYTREFEAFHITSVQVLVAAVIVVPLATAVQGLDFHLVDWQGMTALGYSGLVGTFAAFLMYLYSAQTFGATAAAVTNYVTPVFASLGGMLVLDETITVGMLFGIAVIACGIWLINSAQRRPPQI